MFYMRQWDIFHMALEKEKRKINSKLKTVMNLIFPLVQKILLIRDVS